MSNIGNVRNSFPMPCSWPEEAPEVPAPAAPVELPADPEIIDVRPVIANVRKPPVERRRSPRPDEAMSALLFSDSAFTGSIPCTEGDHKLEGMGLENVAPGMGALRLNIPQDTAIQVHSHAIDREPVPPLPPAVPFGAQLTGRVVYAAMSAWSWIASAFTGATWTPQLEAVDEKADGQALPRDGKLRIHGIEAELTQPLTVTRAGVPWWVAQARITGASIDAHGRVTPKGDLCLFGLFTISLARWRDSLPVLNTEIEKLHAGQLLADSDAEGPEMNVPAICNTLSAVTGQGSFLITRQPGATPLEYTMQLAEPLHQFLPSFDVDITPVKSETNAQVRFNANASLDIEAHQWATNHIHLDSPAIGRQTLRVASESRVRMPQDGAKWWSAHTVFVVDRSANHETHDDAWKPLVKGDVKVEHKDARTQGRAQLRMAPNALGPHSKGGQGDVAWSTDAEGHTRVENATAAMPIPHDIEELKFKVKYAGAEIKGTKKGDGRLHVQASRPIEIDAKKT